MLRIAFKMKLNKHGEEEYKRRHEAIWPELKTLLKKAGIKDYSIFLDEQTNSLFAYLTVKDADRLGELAQEGIMKKWWSHMADIMETNQDNSPVSIFLTEVFYLE
jgi:L-rhamnose mutarotase